MIIEMVVFKWSKPNTVTTPHPSLHTPIFSLRIDICFIDYRSSVKMLFFHDKTDNVIIRICCIYFVSNMPRSREEDVKYLYQFFLFLLQNLKAPKGGEGSWNVQFWFLSPVDAPHQILLYSLYSTIFTFYRKYFKWLHYFSYWIYILVYIFGRQQQPISINSEENEYVGIWFLWLFLYEIVYLKYILSLVTLNLSC